MILFSDVGVYCIPCKNCKLEYIGETTRNCDGKLTKIPKRDFIFARVKTGQVGT